MWWYRAVAVDLDGTLAYQDGVYANALAALKHARAERRTILATGRRADELHQAFPGLAEEFDAVVSENGAVLHAASGERELAEPVDPALDAALAERGVVSQRGRVLLAVAGQDTGAVTEVLGELGLDCQIVHNRGAAMILPAGVTKGSGLLRALEELGLSAHNAVAVGDAENDLALLHTVELGVAVSNAVPSLAEHADVVLDSPDGQGIVDLLAGPLLAGPRRRCPRRHWVSIGEFEDGRPTKVPGSLVGVLISGDTGAGKSYLAGLLAERWIDAGYSVLVVDREGDHVGLAARPGVHLVDAAAHLPSPSELLALTRPHHASLVLDLSGLSADRKLAYVRTLPAAISAERASHGTPHWVIHDEAQQELWAENTQTARLTVGEPGICLVTWQPDGLPPNLRRSIDVTLTASTKASGSAVGQGPWSATVQFAGEAAQPFFMGPRFSPHVRHQRKYAVTPLPNHRRFYFHPVGGETPTVAASLDEFARRVDHCEPATLEYHLSRGDFSRWVFGTLADQELGADLAAIERELGMQRAIELERARQRVIDSIWQRYLQPME